MKNLILILGLGGLSFPVWSNGLECGDTQTTSTGFQVTKGVRLEDSTDAANPGYALIDFVRTKDGTTESYVSKVARLTGLECVFVPGVPMLASCGHPQSSVTLSVRKLDVTFVVRAQDPQSGRIVSNGTAQRTELSFDIFSGIDGAGGTKKNHFEIDINKCREI